jgi:cytoskeletal protein RodZ
MAFVIRQLNEGQTMGEKLHAMRKAANLTLSEMVEKTKIQRKYLRAFEEDDYDALPKPLYAKKFLKRYVQELGGNVDYFLDGFDALCSQDNPDPETFPERSIRKWQLPSLSKFLKVASLVVVGLAVVGYLGWQVRAIIKPPEVMVYSPQDGAYTTSATVTIAGKAEDEAEVKINGDTVLLNRDGTFEEEIALERGVNVITIEGKKRYSKSTEIYRRVVLERERQTAGRQTPPTIP